MTSTTFVDHSTPIVASWANAINNFFYNTCNGATSGPALASAIGAMSTTGSIATGTYDFTGAAVNVATQSAGNNTTKSASTAFTTAAVAVETSRATTAEALKAPIASPTFTGTPLTTNPTYPDNTTKIASTKYVTDAISAATLAPVTNLGAVLVQTSSSVDQNVSANTTTKVHFNNLTAGFDALSEFNTSTNVFTASATGYYLISSILIFQSSSAVITFTVTVGGNTYYLGESTGSGFGSLGGSVVVSMTAAATLTFNCFSSATFTIPSTLTLSTASIKRVL